VGISLCTGSYGEHPYYIESLDVAVYCVEELCVCLQENAFLLDADIMSDELIGWISKECQLEELGKRLYPLVHKKGSLSEYVNCILNYVGLLDQDVIQQTDSILKKSAGRSMLERKKLKADHFLYKGKDMSALLLYDELLQVWEQDKEGAGGNQPYGAAGFRRGILHNKGVVLTRFMRYGEAADCFWEAYSVDPSKDSLVAYLGAMRMYLEESDYIAFLAEHPDFFQVSLLLEKRMEEARQSWQVDKPYARVWGRTQEAAPTQWEGMLRELKERYRRSMS
jgi:tetratricopeptide (TPR) repeat protein